MTGHRLVLPGVCFMFLAACQEAPVTGVPSTTAQESVEQLPKTATLALSPRTPGIDRHYDFLSTRINGFAGLIFEEPRWVVMVASDHEEASVRGIVRAFLADALPTVLRPGSPVEIRRVDFSFDELREWEARLSESVLMIPGVNAYGIDEAANRILISLTDPSAETIVRQDLNDRAIPAEAASFRTVEPLILDSSPTITGSNLAAEVRPLVGGLRIFRTGMPTDEYCTLGFVAIRNGFLGFMTASHCSDTFWYTESSVFWQPNSWSTGFSVGTEQHDPRGYLCKNGLYRCRHSDASFVLITNNTAAHLGYIARPAGSATLDIDPANPLFQINGTLANSDLVVGLNVSKVGSTTGWTSGTIARRCEHYAGSSWTHMGDYHEIRCQFVASYHAQGGDSGSPVFNGPNAEGQVALAGIHWGSRLVSGYSNYERYFSSFDGIIYDFGTVSAAVSGSGGGGGGGIGCDLDPEQCPH